MQAYARHLRENLLKLRAQLLENRVDVGHYHYFKIYDPKERQICAAAFPERVLHHALMNICHPYFEKHLIYDTYATRPEKGIYKALNKAFRAMHTYPYVAKLDFRHYFDNIPHELLKQKLRRLFKDPYLLGAFDKIIDSYAASEGYGIPIGNLTSQYFANYYLSSLDHHMKEQCRVPVYIRYMDDILLFERTHSLLRQQILTLKAYAYHILKLLLKPVTTYASRQGVTFLGYKLYPHKLLLSARSKKRFLHKLRTYAQRLHEALWSHHEYVMHIIPLLSYAHHAYTRQLRRKWVE